jgi:hypothetical protein
VAVGERHESGVLDTWTYIDLVALTLEANGAPRRAEST